MLRGWVMTALLRACAGEWEAPSLRAYARRKRGAIALAMPSTRFERTAQALFWIALIGAMALALMPQPPQLPTDRFGDKFNHMLGFATLAALAALGWPRAERLRVVERLSFLGALIEVAQSIPALHRDCDIRDWIADTLAILAVTALAMFFARRRPLVPAE